MAKVLFFSPNSVIGQFAYPEALVAESLMINKNEVVQISCGKAFSNYCVSMRIFGIEHNATSEQKNNICAECVFCKNRIRQTFGISGYDIVDYIDIEMQGKIEEILNTITKKSFLDLIIHNIHVGRIALYELLITKKKISYSLDDNEWDIYKMSLKNCLISLFTAEKILLKIKPSAIVVYSSEYSVNHTFCLVAKSKGIPFYTMDSGGNLCTKPSTIFLAKNYASTYREELKINWNNYKHIPVAKNIVNLITNHFLELFKGVHPWAYSAMKNSQEISIRDYFGIKKDQKLLTATMSSYDEKFAVQSIRVDIEKESILFNTQIEWIQFLITFFANRNDLFLVIRVHPREFPNKLESITSEHALLLKQSFLKLPDNVKINWPEDNISLYDIASETDVFLNSWSSVGKEMTILGIPVVSYSSKLLSNYHADLNYVGETEESYISQIELALSNGWSYQNIRNTFRWYALEHKHSLFDISNSFPFKPKVNSFLIRGIRKIIRLIVPSTEQYFLKKDRIFSEKNRSPLNDNKLISDLIVENKNTILDFNLISNISIPELDEETEAIRNSLRILLSTLYPGYENGIHPDKILYKNLFNYITNQSLI